MKYLITPSPHTTGEVLLTFTRAAVYEDILRGRAIAADVGGRWCKALCGHVMTKVRAERFVILFESGWSVESVVHLGVRQNRYSKPGRERVSRALAVFQSKPQSIEV